ncbi:hypothetical protein MJ581_09675 [Escherichia coli]|nr:hypothetical protein MJ581_09675 [Escherichia coli]
MSLLPLFASVLTLSKPVRAPESARRRNIHIIWKSKTEGLNNFDEILEAL